MKRNLIQLTILFAILLLLPVVAFAQESGGTTVVIPNGSASLETVLASVIRLVYDATYLPFAAGMVMVLTALSKRAPFLRGVTSSVLSLWWTVILWTFWIGATEVGFGGQFESLIAMMTTIGAAALGITATPMLASKVYAQANASGVAVLGYSRPPARETQRPPGGEAAHGV